MARPGRAALVAAAGWLLLCAPARGEDGPVTFSDELGDGQADEVIAVWSDGHLLGTLHVNPDHQTDSFTATLPSGPLTYALCGMLRRRGPDGAITNHPVDNAGRVPVAPGLTLRAMTLGDVLFALEADGVKTEVGNTPACDAAIS